MMKNRKRCILLWAILLSFIVTGCNDFNKSVSEAPTIQVENIPAYTEEAYIEINNNEPEFTKEEKLRMDAFEVYSPLDFLGRCGIAFANICPEIQPTQERGEIGQIKPSGWHTVKYADLVDGNYLYNRCHLIGYQLSGENANERNLITGTRYMNVMGMLPFENDVADYIEETGNHVLYRVTPIFVGDNLVASGVQMEGWSVEDEGKGICFNVYCYNVQPGITIDYSTGESRRLEETNDDEKIEEYVLNTNTKKIHRKRCSSVDTILDKNRENFKGKKSVLIKQGYSPCGRCMNTEK